jgi:hypothetical protein
MRSVEGKVSNFWGDELIEAAPDQLIPFLGK